MKCLATSFQVMEKAFLEFDVLHAVHIAKGGTEDDWIWSNDERILKIKDILEIPPNMVRSMD